MFKLAFWQVRNIRIYYLLTMIQESWFAESIFIYFILRFVNYQELGILDGVAFFIGFLLEIPSGALADKYSRKRLTTIAMLFSSTAICLQLVAVNKLFIFLGQFLLAGGMALYSGSMEALAYDTLKAKGVENKADEVFEKASLLTYFSFIVTSVIGVMVYQIYFRLPYLLWLVTFLYGLWLSTQTEEIRIKNHHKLTKSDSYLKTLKDGTLHLLTKPLVGYVPALLVGSGFYYMYDYGSVKAVMADFYGYKEIGQTIINVSLTIIIGLIVGQFTEIRKRIGDKVGLLLLSLIVSVGFVWGGVVTNYWGGLAILLILLGGYLGYPWRNVFINSQTESRYRATTISATAFLMKLPYALLAIVFGYMAQNGLKSEFSLGIGIMGLILTGISFGKVI